jgi:predicted ABC-type ATPase
MRVLQGGHDVAPEKIKGRYPRSLENLRRAITALHYVRVYDNSDLAHPYRKLAEYENGEQHSVLPPPPRWFAKLQRSRSSRRR